jgi:glycosyltransferase involved in cell wall biosynthesis
MDRSAEAWWPVPVPVKVSIVVPTYAPGDRINRLVRSLETQTMPTTDFEVIFVDDGSPDQTWQQLEHIRETHDNVRIERIENSGWPSRPRNVGLEIARGEYVLFMDHDDELYPRALEAGYAMAARTGADVLNGKETRTDQAKWAIEMYPANMDNAIDRQDLHPLLPTNPHKLFRRQMLMEHQIRFPEGRRVLWEDVFFALDVAQHTKVISVMADTPFYHWVRDRDTASSTYTQDIQEYWRWLREIVLQTNEKLSKPGFENQWRLMLLFQYASRVLAAIGPDLFDRDSEEFEVVRALVDEIICSHISIDLDAYLTPTQLGKAVLVRAGRWDLLERLVAVDRNLVGISTATSIRWTDGMLAISAESRWTGGGGDKLALRCEGERIVRDLPPEVAAALPREAIDMTSTLDQAKTSLGIRARDTGVNWMLRGACEPRVHIEEGVPELVVTVEALLDPQTAAFGRPLDEASWDVTARNEFSGVVNQRGLRTSIAARSAVQDGHVYIAYKNKKGILTLDVDETNRSLAGSAKLDPASGSSSVHRASLRGWAPGRRAQHAAFDLSFTGVATKDDTIIEGSVTLGDGRPLPARIVAREAGAWLESSVDERPGSYPMRLHFHGREMDSGLDVIVGRRGDVSFTRRPA